MSRRTVLMIVISLLLLTLTLVTDALAGPGAPPSAKQPTATGGPPAPPLPPGAGVIDPEPFRALAGSEDTLVEVYLKGSLLKAISSGFMENDPTTGKVVAGLDAVTAIVVELDGKRLTAARDLLRSTSSRLQKTGWELLARVKDEESDITVLTLTNDPRGMFHGLAVFVLTSDADFELPWRDGEERAEGQGARYELVFANIAGPMRLSDLGRIGAALDLPGLDEATEAIPGQ